MTQSVMGCTVVSFVPFPITEEKPGLIPSRFNIEAADANTPRVLYVNEVMYYVYLDETRGSLPVQARADRVAQSIVDDYVQSQIAIDENSRPGIFWVPGRYSAFEVLLNFKDLCKEAQNVQMGWFEKLGRMGDNDWKRYGQHNAISDVQRKAAEMLGWRPEEHEWMGGRTSDTSIRCPACTMLVPKGAIICSSCKCILDPEKHKTLAFAQ